MIIAAVISEGKRPGLWKFCVGPEAIVSDLPFEPVELTSSEVVDRVASADLVVYEDSRFWVEDEDSLAALKAVLG